MTQKTNKSAEATGDEAPAKPKQLTAAQYRAIVAILETRNLDEAAARCKISRRTLYRWCQDEVFHTAVAELEGQTIDFAVRRLITLQDTAITALKTVIEDPAALAGIRVRASLGVLDAMIKLRELRNIEARLTALEQLYHAKELARLYGDTKPNGY